MKRIFSLLALAALLISQSAFAVKLYAPDETGIVFDSGGNKYTPDSNGAIDVPVKFVGGLLQQGFVVDASRSPSSGGVIAFTSCNCPHNETFINAALARNNSRDVTVQLVNAEYQISGPVYSINGSNIYIRGAGKGRTVIRPTADFQIIQATGSNAAISGAINFVSTSHFGVSGLTVDYQTYAPDGEGNGIVSSTLLANNTGVMSSDGDIRDVEVLGNPGHHYLIWSLMSSNINISRSTVDGGKSTYSTDVDHNGIEIQGGSNINVFANTIRNIGDGPCINIGPLSTSAYTDTANVEVFNNYSENCGKGQLISSAKGTNVSTIQNILVDRNIYKNVFAYGYHGVHSTGSASPNQAIIRNVAYERNIVYMATSGGAAKPLGIYLDGDTAYTNLDVANYSLTHNKIYNVVPSATDGTAYPQYFYAEFVPNFHANDNEFFTPTSLLIQTSGATFSGALITSSDGFQFNRNIIDGTNMQAIRLQTVTNFEVRDNALKNWAHYNNGGGTYTGSSPIHFDSGTSANGIVAGNRGAVFPAAATQQFSFCYDSGATISAIDFINNAKVGYTNGGMYNMSAAAATGTTPNLTAVLNVGTFVPGAQTSVTITDTRITNESIVDVQSETGAVLPTTINPANGSVVITFPGTPGVSDVYRFRSAN